MLSLLTKPRQTAFGCGNLPTKVKLFIKAWHLTQASQLASFSDLKTNTEPRYLGCYGACFA
jgi:hypothetical protein